MTSEKSPLVFNLPKIQDNPDGSWGPSGAMLPAQFKDIPYTPYSKSDKLGRFADWNEIDTQRSSAAPSTALGGTTRGTGRFGPGGRPREGAQAYGAGASTAFAYFHVEDEASFSLVDNKGALAVRRGAGHTSRGRTTGRGAANTSTSFRSGPRFSGRGAAQTNRGGARGGIRRPGWRDWDKPNRTRESSVPISPDWKVLEEIEFFRLTKLRLDVDTVDVETVASYGRLFAYDKAYDRITTKTERPLQILDRVRYNPTTSDDPVIQELASKNTATLYTTDAILSLLMCAPRSVYPWDIVIVRDGDKLFFDKRDGGPFDYITVNENAADPPAENEKDKDNINSLGSLSLEATFIDQHFSFLAVKEDQVYDFPQPNPFYNPDEHEPPLASCAYRYRVFDLSHHEEEDVKMVVRTQVDAFTPGATASAEPGFALLRTLNEFDTRAPGAGGAPDWRTKLDSQRGAVVATEMKNNSCKLAKWAVQSILAGAEVMKLGYVSRVNPREPSRHSILSTATVRPSDFASQLNISLANGWGIVRTVVDLCMKAPDGKYLLVKDPNKPLIRLYSVPMTAFIGDDEELPEEEEEPNA